MNGEGGNISRARSKGLRVFWEDPSAPDITILNLSAPKSLQMNVINKTQFLEFNPLYLGVPFSMCMLKKKEKAMATHFSTLAWKTPWMEELGRLQSMGLLRVGHD